MRVGLVSHTFLSNARPQAYPLSAYLTVNLRGSSSIYVAMLNSQIPPVQRRPILQILANSHDAMADIAVAICKS